MRLCIPAVPLFALLASCELSHGEPRPELTDDELSQLEVHKLLAEAYPERPAPEYFDRILQVLASKCLWTPAAVQRIKARETWVGADIVATLLALGKPRKWDTTHVAGGRIDYLFYGDILRGGKLVTLRNHFVESWSTH